MQHGDEDDEGVTDLRSECENYIYTGARTSFPRLSMSPIHSPFLAGDSPPIPFSTLLTWYSRLRPGLSVSSWMEELALDSKPIDVRRMLQFGVIKGFLRRVHAHPVWLDHPTFKPASNQSKKKQREADGRREETPAGSERPSRRDTTVKPSRRRLEPNLPSPSSSPRRGNSSTATPSHFSTPAPDIPVDAPAPPQTLSSLAAHAPPDPPTPPLENPAPSYPHSLPLLLDGSHSTDEVCLRYGITWRTLEAVLRHLGGAQGEEGREREEYGFGGEGEEGRRRGAGAHAAAEKGPYGTKVVMLWV